jgi:hypothetical protein
MGRESTFRSTADGGVRLLASSASIVDPPAAPDFVRFPKGTAPRFLVTVDTEEEFDWSAPLRREGHTLDTIAAFPRFVDFCEGFGVVPTFLIDHPIATASATAAALRAPLAAGRAEVGIHLHPWVNPPFDEEIGEFNSYAGNLPPALEREKFLRLRDAIEANLGVAVGPNSAAMLREAGIAIDSSVRARFDYSSTGGPNFREHPLRPYWLDRERGLVELPITTVFSGLLRGLGDRIYPYLWREPRLRGVLARARLLERIPLTPEGISPAEAIRGIDCALADGLPLLVFSFHSPSLAPAHTPYVRNAGDLEAFYDWWRQVFTHLVRRGAAPTCVRELVQTLAPDKHPGLQPPLPSHLGQANAREARRRSGGDGRGRWGL